ncbi:hypothetical protein [Leptospira ilyithenensis]|uniref:Uncharacterized protein n=1 Tax=Leptospira ilyithenensis TaxID=2484901 RepID=A0A4R9LM50_9LEPT|nr:hypothetical protein [Leptospira ilyithenensis]TGN09398.1 hypothetical protein EHS11_12680 [Leptospira ilyithenensis]
MLRRTVHTVRKYFLHSQLHYFISSIPSGFDTDGFLFGPIHLVGIHFLLLAYYNLIAVFYQIEPLIEAGMRGGGFTCVFLLALVILGILSPMVLLIPLVDLISVVFLLGKRLIRR